MAREHEVIVQRFADAATERDVDTFIELTHPDVEWHSSISVISEGGAYHGHDGVRQYIRDIDETFEAFVIDLEGALAVGDVALGVGRVTYRGRTSGIEQTDVLGWAFRFRDGRVSHLRAFRDPEAVLGAIISGS